MRCADRSHCGGGVRPSVRLFKWALCGWTGLTDRCALLSNHRLKARPFTRYDKVTLGAVTVFVINFPHSRKSSFQRGARSRPRLVAFLFFGAYVDKVIGSKEVLLSPWAFPNRKKLDDYALGARVPSPVTRPAFIERTKSKTYFLSRARKSRGLVRNPSKIYETKRESAVPPTPI